MKIKIHNILLLLSVGIACVFTSCSSQKKNFFSKTFHNTTAHYNAYFIARENIEEVEDALQQNHKNNYNRVLSVLYDVDSATIDGLRDKLDDCIVKASLAVQRHENSKWVDDSYYLIGKSRFYGGDFVNAIETFKYININSEDKDTRHQALIFLMRTFIDYNEHNNAVAEADFLKKEELSKENSRDLEIIKAYLYQVREEYENMGKSIENAVKLEKRNQYASRYYFILGQIYQKAGQDTAAFKNYNKCLKHNPEYEMSFYAKLNLAQVSYLGKNVNVKKIRKYFRKLLKDDKNKEYVDKIYYEMAGFELKHSNPDKAIDYYNSSVRSSISNPRQKGYSYLKLGEIYYDLQKNYTLAQAYYDSAVQTIPSDDEKFESTKERQLILNDFVEQINTIQLQDSLLALSEMDKDKLDALIEKVIEEEKEREKEREKEARKRERQAQSISNFGNNEYNPFANDQTADSGDGSSWYFYNLTAISSGRSAFLRRWGNRPLEDNWRRSKKEAAASFETNTTDVKSDTMAIESDKQDAVSQKDEKARYMNSIPFSEEAKTEALKKVEDAHYKLGGIYNFQLNEKPNAVSVYKDLLKRFPDSKYEPEVMYLLFLIFQEEGNPESETYKNRLISEHPKTIYAKLAENPNYEEESNETSQRLQKLYKIAYEYYQKEDFNQASLLVSRALQQYPDNEFSDQLRLLNILILGKVEGQVKYQYELQQFIENYPKSTLNDYAKSLLEASKSYKEKEIRRLGAKYISDTDMAHFFVIVYPETGNLSKEVPGFVEKFVEENYSDIGLNVGTMVFNEANSLVLVNKFDMKKDALDFLTKFNSGKIEMPSPEKGEYTIFVISEDNFQILVQTKKLDDYLTFYKENYK